MTSSKPQTTSLQTPVCKDVVNEPTGWLISGKFGLMRQNMAKIKDLPKVERPREKLEK